MKPKKSRFVDVSKLSGNFSIDKHTKTLFIRADCDRCFKWECVTSYEEDVGKRDFTIDFFECLSCNKVVCDICRKEESGKKLTCPLCGKEGLKKLSPKRILECHTCITTSKVSCPVCEYLD